MASPCLSRLLLIFLLGATNVVAHPMSKDKPTESGNAVVQESPSLEWKPKKESHKHNHVHHGTQESTVTFQKITVRLDDKDGPKHKSDADEDEESTKTEYPSKASAKHGETTGTTHNHKDAKRSDWPVKHKLTDEEVDEMERLAHSYTLLTRKEKLKLEKMFMIYQRMKEEEVELNNSKPGRVKEPKYNVIDDARKHIDPKDQLDNLEKDEGYKPKDAKPWWALTTDKYDEAKHHRNELASTGEKGVEAKRKITKRCEEFLPWWVQLIIKKVRKDKARKKEEERKKMEEEKRLNRTLAGSPPSFRLRHELAAGVQKDSVYSKLKRIKEMEEKSPNALLRDKHKDWFEDKTNKAFDKKPSEEKENKPSSSVLQQKKDKEDKQKSEVQPKKASENSKDGHSNQSKNSLTARMFPPRPLPFPVSMRRPESTETVIVVGKRGKPSNVRLRKPAMITL